MNVQNTPPTSQAKRRPVQLAISIVCYILIAFLLLILIGNITFIIKGAATADAPPSVFGVIPLVTLSGSMEGTRPDSFREGSLLIMTKPKDLQEGDVIAFQDPTAAELVIVSHRIHEITTGESGETLIYTKGDANNAPDTYPITPDAVYGKYAFHLEKVGSFALFLKEPLGMLLFIGLPILAFILYDLIRHRKQEAEKNRRDEKMAAELERLRVAAGEATAPGESIPAATELAQSPSAVENTTEGEPPRTDAAEDTKSVE
jgi:signal peptidase